MNRPWYTTPDLHSNTFFANAALLHIAICPAGKIISAKLQWVPRLKQMSTKNGLEPRLRKVRQSNSVVNHDVNAHQLALVKLHSTIFVDECLHNDTQKVKGPG